MSENPIVFVDFYTYHEHDKITNDFMSLMSDYNPIIDPKKFNCYVPGREDRRIWFRKPCKEIKDFSNYKRYIDYNYYPYNSLNAKHHKFGF